MFFYLYLLKFRFVHRQPVVWKLYAIRIRKCAEKRKNRQFVVYLLVDSIDYNGKKTRLKAKGFNPILKQVRNGKISKNTTEILKKMRTHAKLTFKL